MHPLSRLRRLLELLDEMFPAAYRAAKLALLAGDPDGAGTALPVKAGQLRRLAALLDEPAPAWPGSSLPAADAPDDAMEGQAD